MAFGINNNFNPFAGFGNYGNLGNFSNRNSVNSISALSNPFDYKAAQKELKEKIDTYKQQSTKIQSLKKDTADYLTKYTDDMTNMKQAAGKLSNGKLTDMLGDVSSGEVSKENMKKVTDAVQNLVDSYNTALTTTTKNAERGSGTALQAANLKSAPMSSKVMDMIGVSQGKDGTLSLDADKLSAAITKAAASDAKGGTKLQMGFLKDVLGGSSGFAGNIQNKAARALNSSARSLVNNDLGNIQQEISNNSMNFANLYTRSGSTNMMNMASAGLMMNLFA